MTLDWSAALLWSAAATGLLSMVLAFGHGLGWTRLSLSLLLGTAVSDRRGPAVTGGAFGHLALGFAFGLGYVLLLEWWGAAVGADRWARLGAGAAIGLVHAALVLVVAMPLLPWLHPRMVLPGCPPQGERRLEPPGLLARGYGRATPWVVLAAHALFGATVGGLYVP